MNLNLTMPESRLSSSVPDRTIRFLNQVKEARLAPLNDDISKEQKSGEVPTPRRNPKMRLLTSSSSMSLESGDHSDDDSGDWTMTSFISDLGPTPDIGLMITIENGCCEFKLVPDANFPQIHPHVYAPADISDMRILYGGGSGVAVFGGHHPDLGDIVMKHGGYKDANELFALATISQELHSRGYSTGHLDDALAMQERIPSFKMLYISPHHIMSRGQELIGVMKNFIRAWSLTSLPSMDSFQRNKNMRRASELVQNLKPKLDVGMKIRIFEGEDETSTSFILDTNTVHQSLSLILPKGSTECVDSNTVQIKDNAYDALKCVVDELTPIMTERMFKFTLGQKTIGGVNPKTGNQWLYEGKLSGALLQNLMDQFIQVVRHLQSLTLPEEVDVVNEIRQEVLRFESDEVGLRADDISDVADAFVGNAIKKNYHPEKGRQRFLREICAKFRDGTLILTPEEEIPAFHLGMLLRSGALMSDTFVNTPMEPTVLQPHPHFWRNILRRAVDGRKSMSPTALQRLWTCGLTDAGIHNLFVSESSLHFFDLGEPQLMSLPGFLTKFLFSFFHTLGMENDGDGSWVRRFVVVGDKLALTKETLDLLPKAYDAFEECLDRAVEELLDNDRHIRWLLLEYITMQLLSDASFCLQKWEVKGGGKTRDGNHQMNQEKWLWRALWDIYVAFDINASDSWYRFDVEHPHFRDSFRASTMETFSDSFRSTSSSIRNSMVSSLRTTSISQEDNLLNLLSEQEEEA